MKRLSRTLLALACAGAATSVTAAAAMPTELTLYRSDAPGLFASGGDGTVSEGYAVVRERRILNLRQGEQDVAIDDLPLSLDAEAMALAFADGGATVRSQRLLLGQGNNAALAGLVGQPVEVLGGTGQPMASGTLQRAGDGLVVADATGRVTLIRDFAAVRAQGGHFPSGSSLRLHVAATKPGEAPATLSYATNGLGWRAAYVGTLQPGEACRLRFESRASIANRSGRDWHDARLNLVAGEPRINAVAAAPRPMMARAFAAKASEMPEQSTLADYRMYSLPAPVDLPDGSVSQVPLYATRDVDCERTALYEAGNQWQPPQPLIGEAFDPADNAPVTSTLRLKAFDSLPAGNLRVLGSDRAGTPQFIGEARIEDTPKGADATLTLGNAFDLRARRERTSFKLDKAARSLDEAIRVTLSNAGDAPRTVTVREHPSRWRQWTLTTASIKPSKQSPDMLEFRVAVPANGEATLDYAVRYGWTADQIPTP